VGLLDRYIVIHVNDKPINAVVRRFANQVREALLFESVNDADAVVMISTQSENWLRIRGVEVCFCLFTDPIESVNGGLFAFSQINRIGICINLFYTLLVKK
jgi:CO dehydrogenase/acetyl-CoA synthase gamma subunit (corrinoid Fe-S protein)